MQEITVEVTAEDIESGVRGDGWHCPIAHALWRVTGRKWNVLGRSACEIARAYRRVQLPLEARAFVEHFDDKKRVAPFTFKLDISHEEIQTT